MHAKTQVREDELTDSMRMFKLGVEGGKPQHGEPGAQPEWFYKGDGDCVVGCGRTGDGRFGGCPPSGALVGATATCWAGTGGGPADLALIGCELGTTAGIEGCC